MNVKNILWHSFPGYGTDQLGDGKKILAVCAGVVGSEFVKLQLIHRSNSMTLPPDSRINVGAHGRTPSYPQDWHFNWIAWTKAALLTPAGFPPTRFGIGIYLPETRELRICAGTRRINDGPFAMRLTNENRQVFLLAERQIGVRSAGIFGGTEAGANPLVGSIDLY